MSGKFKLRAAFPKPKRLNGALVMLCAGVILLILLMSSVSSLSRKPQVSSPAGPEQTAAKKPAQADEQVTMLPGGYGDAAQIDNILKQRTGDTSAGGHMELLSDIERLRQEQRQLKMQLQQIGQSNRQTDYRQNVMDREATNSAIFFAGGAPRPDQAFNMGQSDATKDQEGDKKKQDPFRRPGYNDPNMQTDKLAFLNAQPDASIYNQNPVQYPASKFIVQAGTVIPAILVNKLVSDLPGVIIARVKSDVYDSITGKYLLIPKGTKLMGEYSSKVSYGQRQMQAKFTRLIREDGSSVSLPNQPGINDMGVSGFEDEVNNHWGRIMGSAFMMTIFNIPSIVAAHQLDQSATTVHDTDGKVVSVTRPLGKTVAASSLESLGKSVSQVGTDIARRSLNIQPTVTINAGYTFSVMVTKDVVLPPSMGRPAV